MSFLRSVRPSNLIILTALPFIIYLFASSGDYQRSLRAILGVENGSSAFVPGFLALLVAFGSGVAALVFSRAKAPRPRLALAAAVLNLAAAATVLLSDAVHPYLASVVANAVDSFTSDLVVKGLSPRQLTDAADMTLRGIEAVLFPAYFALTLLGFMLFFGAGKASTPESIMRRLGALSIGLVNGAGLLFILFFAHIAFAAGVATTVRAAIAAYLLAAIIGLTLVAAWFLLQPRTAYVLAGRLDGTVAIVSNTPSGLIGAVRFGQYPGAPGEEAAVRTFLGPAEAVAAMGKNEVTAALLPSAAVPGGLPLLWETAALNDRDRAAGITFAVLAIILGLLTFGGYLHRRHPLAIGSEFVVDTIRGIPMLVIVLYVGLPLSGALKDATQGVLDPPNLMRGIVAMALAYSAYLAEIFRSGINAIPIGQIEAARSIGLNRWQTARLVVLPQAFRIIIPPLGNELIAILKDTSLLSILSIRDITQRMREFQSASFLPFAPYNSAAIFYIFLTLAAASLINMIERKYDIKHR